MEIVIEKNVPLPERSGDPLYQALMGMEVGDSFALPIDMRGLLTLRMTRVKRRTNRVFLSRKMDESTVRCWRKA